MPGYVKDALLEFQHPTPTIPHHSLHQWTAPHYGSTAPQMLHPIYDSPALNIDEANNVQQVVGTLFYYAHAVDPTVLVSLNIIAAEQSKSTQETAKKWCSLSIIRPATLRQSPDTTPE